MIVKLSDVIPEVSAVWQRNTVYRLAAEGKLPGVYKRAYTWVVDRTVFDPWLKAPPNKDDATIVAVPSRTVAGSARAESPASALFDKRLASRTPSKRGKQPPRDEPDETQGRVGYFNGVDDDELFGTPWPASTTLGEIRELLSRGAQGARE